MCIFLLQMEADPGASAQRAEELLSLPLQQNEALEVRCWVPLLRGGAAAVCCCCAGCRIGCCRALLTSLRSVCLSCPAVGHAAQRPALCAAPQPLAALPL